MHLIYRRSWFPKRASIHFTKNVNNKNANNITNIRRRTMQIQMKDNGLYIVPVLREFTKKNKKLTSMF